MTYDVFYTTRARRDLIAAADYIAIHAPETAERWFNGFVAALGTLSENAHVFGLAPENERSEVEVRQFIYRTKSGRANRALFTIQGTSVIILAVRRPGQDIMADDDLRQAFDELD